MNVKSKIFFSALTIGVSLLVSCAKEEDDNTEPSSGDSRDNYLGTWNCTEESKMDGTSYYTVTIDKSSTSSTQILLKNLNSSGAAISTFANVSGNSFTIPQQWIASTADSIKGNGSISGTSLITIHFTTYDGTRDTARATLTK